MSYILEALKKSQSDRELGQVPRLEGFGIDVPIEPPRRHPWAYVALLAGLAVVGVAILLLVRGLGAGAPVNAVAAAAGPPPSSPVHDNAAAGPTTQPTATDVAGRAQSAQASVAPAEFQHPLAESQPVPDPAARQATDTAAGSAQVTAGAPSPMQADAAADTAVVPGNTIPGGASIGAQSQSTQPAAAGATAAAAAAAGATPSTASRDGVEPQVLVVPAPGKPGEPLPRGADELRRAVLGDAAGASAAVAGADARRTPPTLGPSESKPALSSDRVPVPEDVLAEVEAFKQLVRQRNPQALERAAEPPPLPEPRGLEAALRPQPQMLSKPAPPSLDLRSRLPLLSMTVHVYNDDPRRRFVYINGRKLTEGQRSREGIRLEEVVTDGAVLSYEGETFFQQR